MDNFTMNVPHLVYLKTKGILVGGNVNSNRKYLSKMEVNKNMKMGDINWKRVISKIF